MGKITDYIVNKSSTLLLIYSVFAVVMLVLYSLANVSMYFVAQSFAEEHGADEIVIELVQEPAYKRVFYVSEFEPPTVIDYEPSYFKFYLDGEDIVDKYELYFEYQEFTVKTYSAVGGMTLVVVVNFVVLAIGFANVAFSRHFAHPYIIGVMIFIIIFSTADLYLNFYGVLFMLTLFSLNLYFARKNRFCDYNESRLTAIFKKVNK